jgi:hypothetical protein
MAKKRHPWLAVFLNFAMKKSQRTRGRLMSSKYGSEKPSCGRDDGYHLTTGAAVIR